jgi:hypothetical protein
LIRFDASLAFYMTDTCDNSRDCSRDCHITAYSLPWGEANSLLRSRVARSTSAYQGVFSTRDADFEYLQWQIVSTKYLLCFPPKTACSHDILRWNMESTSYFLPTPESARGYRWITPINNLTIETVPFCIPIVLRLLLRVVILHL